MSAKSESRNYKWLIFGVLGWISLLAMLFYIYSDADTVSDQFAFRAKRVDLVNAMALDVASLAEAHDGAVMSKSDRESQVFVGRARDANESLTRRRSELESALKEHGDAHELELMDRVTKSVVDIQSVDKQLMETAVKKSNLKAYSLAFGPITQCVQEMDVALTRLMADDVLKATENDLRIVLAVSEVRIGVLRMQVVLLPHIAEDSSEKMDAFEAQLAADDANVREKLAALAQLLSSESMPILDSAKERFDAFEDLKSQALKLSRENTDLRSVAIALNEKRRATIACQESLAILKQAIQEEPIVSAIPAGR